MKHIFGKIGGKKKGLTLVEILIAMAIMLLIAAAITRAINPAAMVGKGNDAQRKKDVGRIKVAFEEYFNDKGHYPQASLVVEMMDPQYCNSDIFSPWMNPWPCDPKGRPYLIAVGDNTMAPTWYKIMANLENKSDPEIPDNWDQGQSGFTIGDGSFNSSQANWGVSSGNVSWNDYTILAKCQDSCYYKPLGMDSVSCDHVDQCRGPNCFGDNNCSPECQMVRCPN